MTSFAFILGVVPLVLATGAGASARKSIGIAVFSGMLASTCLGGAVRAVVLRRGATLRGMARGAQGQDGGDDDCRPGRVGSFEAVPMPAGAADKDNMSASTSWRQ